MKWILLLLPILAFAKDFGTLGQVFPIEEESLLQYMERSMPKKSINEKMTIAKQVLFEKAKNPLPVRGLKPATKARSFLLDFTFKVDKDILDTKGNLIVKAGDKVNPLDKVQLSTGLLFLDGENKSHLAWAREQGKCKWILVKGKPFELEVDEKRPIYYDQGGRYISRFQIENIPAKIVQKGSLILVEEVVLEAS